MSEAPDWPLSKVWRPVGSSQRDLDPASKAKVLTQLGSVTWKLSQLRFKNIGSLFKKMGRSRLRNASGVATYYMVDMLWTLHVGLSLQKQISMTVLFLLSQSMQRSCSYYIIASWPPFLHQKTIHQVYNIGVLPVYGTTS